MTTVKQVAQPTPGPWFAREQKSQGGESLGWIVEYGNGRIGWSSYATNKPNKGECAPFPVSAANARLIAAAPDLLAALKAVQRVFAWDGSLPRPDDVPAADDLLQMVDDAIKRAEGR